VTAPTLGRGPGSASTIVAATVAAGVAGYLVTVLAKRELGDGYALFAIFWAALYLVVGGLSGIQQEVTRATRPIGTRTRTTNTARNFALAGGVAVLVAIVSTSPVWSAAVFSGDGWLLVLPLAVGTSSYVLVATLSGSLFGVSQWRSIAILIAVDGLLRLALVAVGLFATDDIVVIAWLVAAPFPITLLIAWPIIRRSFVGTSDLDVGYRALSWNVLRTVFASVSAAVLVSGFPLLLGVVSEGVSARELGEYIFVITLTRAPLIVTVMALQGFLVVRFRDRPDHWLRFFLSVQGVLLVGAAVLSALAWWLGPPVFELVSGDPVTLDGGVMALLVISSALVGALSVSGAAVLARADHFAYSVGWVVAAVVTVVVIALPVDFATRVQWALVAGPVAGLVVHLAWLFGRRSTTAR